MSKVTALISDHHILFPSASRLSPDLNAAPLEKAAPGADQSQPGTFPAPSKRSLSLDWSDVCANGEGQPPFSEPAPPPLLQPAATPPARRRRGHDSPGARGAVSLPARRFNCYISSALIRAKRGVGGVGGLEGGE